MTNITVSHILAARRALPVSTPSASPATPADSDVLPLRRNRDFLLLQAGQLLSNAGTESTSIAYPLLVLAVTHSAAKAGVVSFAGTLPWALFALPAGVVADRRNRKWLMIAADAVRVCAIGGLAAAILLHRIAFWAIPLVAFVEGSGAALFSAAQAGALRAVVPPRQLPAATNVRAGREATVRLAGPPLGGALFGLARALPFLVDVLSYGFSIVSLLAMRAPFQEGRAPDRSPLRSRLAEGVRFIWGHPFLRTCALLYGLANFIGPGVLLAVVVIGRQQGLSGGAVGALVAAFGACLLLGSFAAPLVRRLLPVRAVLLLELWTWLGCGLFLVWPNVYALTAGLLPTALAIPSTDSVVVGYGIAMTPDRLLGRAESVRRTISLLVAPLGPLAAGFLLGAVSARATIAVFAACGLALALWGTLSPAVRGAPSLDQLDDLPGAEPSAAGTP
jgi:Transmembrane secretion effector